MANRKSLSTKARSIWQAEMRVAREFYDRVVYPTAAFAEATKDNTAHWRELSWPYPKVTANYLYANQQAVLPRVLMREPKVIAKPASRMTAAFQRVGQVNPVDRFVASVVIQQIVNWRIREFDFTKQVRRMVRDDYTRGMGFIRHGYLAEGDKSMDQQGRPIEFETHKHLREGWPYAVHQPLDYVLWDQKARDIDERQWVAFGKLWRPDDLKRWLGIRREIQADVVIGTGLNRAQSWQDEMAQKFQQEMGYACVWEIWDRREKNVVFWLEKAGEELAVRDWPLEFEGLPDSVLISNESNERIEPVSEPSILWELQGELNQLVSMLLVYAKRGVSTIGIDKSVVDPEEIDKLLEAEIFEVIQVKGGDVAKAIQVLRLESVPQTLIVAIQTVLNLIREVGSVSSFERGTRENVDTATEAARIGQGGDLRQAMRAEAVRAVYGEVVRKDWQVLQQTTTTDQIVDVAAEGPLLFQVRATTQQIQMEYDFEIQVGSTEPLNENGERVKAVAFVQAMMVTPEIARQVNPRQQAEMLCRAFGYDETEQLASMDATQQQIVADKLTEALGGAGTPGAEGAAQRLTPGGGGQALDALKSRPDNKNVIQ